MVCVSLQGSEWNASNLSELKELGWVKNNLYTQPLDHRSTEPSPGGGYWDLTHCTCIGEPQTHSHTPNYCMIKSSSCSVLLEVKARVHVILPPDFPINNQWYTCNVHYVLQFFCPIYSIGYILNVTREIDNFYPEVFKYLNIRYTCTLSGSTVSVYFSACTEWSHKA